MQLGKFGWTFLSLIIFLLSTSAARAATCDIQEETDPRIAGRSESVTLPDGKKITIIGFQHGDRGFWRKVIDLLNQTRLSNSEFTQRLHKLLADVDSDFGLKDKTIGMAQKNLSYLRDQMKSDSPLGFVADEARMEDSMAFQKLTPQVGSALYEQVWKRNLPPSPDYANTLLIVGGAATYLKMTEPSLFKSTSIVGFETDAAQNNAETTWNQFLATRAQLREAAKADPEYVQKMNETLDDIYSLYMTGPYDPAVHDKIIHDELQKKLPKEHFDLAMKTVDALLTTMKATLERDQANARSMIKTHQSGILFIGQLHLKSVARYVKQFCQQSSSNGGTTAPTLPVPNATR